METFKKVFGYGRSDEKCWQKLVNNFFKLVRFFLGVTCLYLLWWNSFKLYRSWMMIDLLLEILLFFALLFYLDPVLTRLKTTLDSLYCYFFSQGQLKPEPWWKSVWYPDSKDEWSFFSWMGNFVRLSLIFDNKLFCVLKYSVYVIEKSFVKLTFL